MLAMVESMVIIDICVLLIISGQSKTIITQGLEKAIQFFMPILTMLHHSLEAYLVRMF